MLKSLLLRYYLQEFQGFFEFSQQKSNFLRFIQNKESKTVQISNKAKVCCYGLQFPQGLYPCEIASSRVQFNSRLLLSFICPTLLQYG